jgi:hypothetical protein
MFKSRLSKILDECIGRIWAGEATIEECLRMYPEHAKQLAPMLALAVNAHASMAPQKPKPGYVKASRQRISKRLSKQLQNSAARRVTRKPLWKLKPAQTFLSLMLALSVLAVGLGVIQASAAALPGDALYGLKLGLERAQLALSLHPSSDIELLTRRADTRLDELQNLVGEGKGEGAGVGLALDGYGQALSHLTDLSTTTDPEIIPGSLEHVLERLAKHQDVLALILEQAPPSAQPAIEHAMQQSSHSQEVIQQVRQGGNPGELAPGQQRTPPGQQRTPPGQGKIPPWLDGMPPGQNRTSTPEPSETPPPEPPAPPPEAHTLHVKTLSVVNVTGNANNWLGFVTATIVRDDGQLITNATMHGTWTYAGGGPESICCLPQACRVLVQTGATTATFEVMNVVGPYPYAPLDNVESVIVVQFSD